MKQLQEELHQASQKLARQTPQLTQLHLEVEQLQAERDAREAELEELQLKQEAIQAEHAQALSRRTQDLRAAQADLVNSQLEARRLMDVSQAIHYRDIRTNAGAEFRFHQMEDVLQDLQQRGVFPQVRDELHRDFPDTISQSSHARHNRLDPMRSATPYRSNTPARSFPHHSDEESTD